MPRKPSELNDPPTVVKVTFLDLIICAKSDATDEELIKAANEQNVCGTEKGWALVARNDEKPQYNPVPCAECEGRTHFVISC